MASSRCVQVPVARRRPPPQRDSMSAPRPHLPFERRLREAHVALLGGRAQLAERLLRDLDSERPGDLNSHWLIGASLLEQGRTAESIEILEGVVARAGDFANARIDLARAYRSAGQSASAREHVRRVLAEHPHHPLAWLAYGDVLVEPGGGTRSRRLPFPVVERQSTRPDASYSKLPVMINVSNAVGLSSASNVNTTPVTPAGEEFALALNVWVANAVNDTPCGGGGVGAV